MFNYDIIWTEKREGDWEWVDEIFNNLGAYYNKFIKDVAEIPFLYSERSLVGDLAIAAHQSWYYTLQDYSTKIKRKELIDKKEYRFPDLWLTMEPRENSCDYLFEVKTEVKSIDKIMKNLQTSVCDVLREVHKKYKDEGISLSQEVKWQCALMVIKIKCLEKEWDDYGKDFRSYHERLEKLKKDIIKINWDDCEGKPDFCFYYWIPFNNQKNNLKNYLWKNKFPKSYGVLWFGSFEQVN